MAYNFFRVDRDQLFLLPPSLRDWVPEEDLSWFVLDAVSHMNLKQFYREYRADGQGGKGYEPSMMVALLLYGYCLGERSSRRIEWLCQRDVGFKVVAANQTPDHCSVARFRQNHEERLAKLFKQVLRLCAKAGLVKLGVVALDGTKIKASAAMDANRTAAGIDEEVSRILREAAAKDAEEDRLYGDRRGDELPEGLRTRKERMERLRACREELERQESAAQRSLEAKKAERAAKEAKASGKIRGRKPKEKKPEPAKANVTDPDSRIMKTRSGYVQGYNAQIVVTKEQIILAAEVTQEANDMKQLGPMVAKARENAKEVLPEGSIGMVLGDAGYWSEANIAGADSDGPELLLATTKDWKQRKALRELPPPRGRVPNNLSARDRMERKLLTKRGRKRYRLRGRTVEPAFGQIKEVRGCNRFMRRGNEACDSEWKLIAATHNLLKLWRSGAGKRQREPRMSSRGRKQPQKEAA